MTGSDLPDELIEQVRAMYEERTGKGKRKYSQIMVGRHFDLSETTVFRIVNGLGAFAGRGKPAMPKVTPEQEAESLRKLREELDKLG